MADSTTERKITLGDKTYPVRLTFGILTKAEQKSGSNFMNPATWKPLKVTDMLALVWAITGAHDDGLLSYDRLADTMVPSFETYDTQGVLIGAWADGFAKVDEEPAAPFTPESEGGGPAPASTSDSRVPSTTT